MEELIKKFMAISRIIGAKNFEFIKEKGYRRIGIGQMAIIRMVLDSPGLVADDICKALELDKATVAIAMKHLMVGGLIRREVDEDDHRKKRLYATDKLNAASAEIENEIRRQIKRITHGFSEKDIEVFGGYLDRIRENISRDI
jgi:DNA-binding MarR family transcriptional regulator